MAEALVDKEALQLIRRVVLEEAGRLGVGVEGVILFGSRARGDYGENSDYDILIIVDHASREVKRRLWRNIHRRLVRSLKTPVDVVIVALPYWRKYGDTPGTILYSAKREGITIARRSSV